MLSKIVYALGTDYESIFSFTIPIHKNELKSKLDLINDEETLKIIEEFLDLLLRSQ